MSLAITLWREAEDLILPDVRDCPWEMADKALKLAAREFFTRTTCWGLWTTGDLFTIAGSSEYTLFAGTGVEVIKVRECKVGSDNYMGAGEQQFGSSVADNSHEKLASWFDNSLNLYPTPSVDGKPINAYLLLRPTHKATGLPKAQWVQHIDAIVLGALRNLYGAHEKPYSDGAQFLKHEALFKKACDDARSAAQRGGFGRVRVAYQGF